MALREAHGDAEAQPVTPMEEIRRRKGMPFEEFCAKHPYWEWTESRLARRMIDSQGRVWVPMWNPNPGVGICYDPELTPEAEVYIAELSRKALEDALAGKGTYLDELDDWDD